ncbi:MAG: serine/threonine protein kinase, partial [Planctomycetes bacterium]|nr:serine/threonine protein kinase [Planctomycetota bacterium]
MKNRTEDHDDDLERFRRTFRSDVASKTVKPLSAYRTQWPGHEEAIAAEYVAWKQANATRAGYIGPYRIVSELGRGGQAVVYLCDDERLGRKVAVKVLLGLGGSTERTLTRFRREAEITSRLDHPGICALYETGIGQGGVPWIAMCYVEGQPLSTVLAATRRGGSEEPTLIVIDYENVEEPSTGGDRTPTTTTPSASRIGRRDMDELLVIIEKTARALHVAHESGIIHRDVKPGNIMVAKGGQPVVLDFGFACADEDGHPTMTRTGELLGTPAYMSPEQLTAQRVALDRRTDIWSLGVTLYECLTLQRPFDAPSREALYRQILTKEPEDVRRLNPAIPAELAILLQTAMDKDPDRRYATAEAFADDLQRVREKKPIVARPMSALLRGRRWAQRNPSVAAMTIAVFLLISTFAVVMFLKNSQLEAKTIEAEGNARAARRNEDIANHNAALAARSAAEATRNFAEARRLADLKKLAEAHADLDALWPLGQDLLPRIVRFRQTYSELFDRLPDHEATLTKLEADALPYSKEEREADHGASL